MYNFFDGLFFNPLPIFEVNEYHQPSDLYNATDNFLKKGKHVLWNTLKWRNILNSFHLFDNRKVFEKGEQAEVWESLVVPGENTILLETDSVLQSPD